MNDKEINKEFIKEFEDMIKEGIMEIEDILRAKGKPITFENIAKEIEREFKEFEELEKLEKIDNKNFDGMSEKEVFFIIFDPFGKNSPLTYNKDISHDFLFENSPFYRMAIELMIRVKKNNFVLLDDQYLLPELVCELYNLNIYNKIEDKYYEEFLITRNEDLWDFLFSVKQTCILAKLLKIKNNEMSLTKRGETFLTKDKGMPLFIELLKSYCLMFNISCLEDYADTNDEDFIQDGIVWLLWLLKKYGSELRDIKFYLKKYLKAFPDFKNIKKKDYLFYLRFIEHFCNFFGFVEQVENQEDDIKASNFLNNFIK